MNSCAVLRTPCLSRLHFRVRRLLCVTVGGARDSVGGRNQYGIQRHGKLNFSQSEWGQGTEFTPPRDFTSAYPNCEMFRWAVIDRRTCGVWLCGCVFVCVVCELLTECMFV